MNTLQTLEAEVGASIKAGTCSEHLVKKVINFLTYQGESECMGAWLKNLMMCEGEYSTPNDGSPVVSVIIPCHNYGSYLAECIDSVLRQSFRAWEIIIINDGSTDDTHEVAQSILERFPDHAIRYYKQKQRGIVQPRNRGVTLAKGEFILPLDADDLISPKFLERTVAHLRSRPNLGYVSTKTLFFGSINKIWPNEPFAPLALLATNQQTNTTLYRKAMWQDVGGYEERMIHGYMDWEFWIRCTKNGWLGEQLEEPMFFYRRKVDSVVMRAKERDVTIKKQIVRLHPDVYDASRLKEFEKDLHRPNWIPPQLVRADLRIKNRGGAMQQAEQKVAHKLDNLKKHILGMLVQIDSRMKRHFLKPEAGTGNEAQFTALHNQISIRASQFIAAGQTAEAVDIAAILLSLYPLEKKAVLLFMDSLNNNKDFIACYKVGSFFLSIWDLDQHLFELMGQSLCFQAEEQDQDDKVLAFLEGATLMAPSYRLAWIKKIELLTKKGMLRAAERTAKQAGKHGVQLPAVLTQERENPRSTVKNVWYVIDSFGYEAGGVNGVSQAKFMTLGSLLHNDDICNVSVVSPLTPKLPSAIAEFTRQYNSLKTKTDAAWPEWIPTVSKDSSSGMAVEDVRFKGRLSPCVKPDKAPDLIIMEGVRRLPYEYFTDLGVDFGCKTMHIHHASPAQFSKEFNNSDDLEQMIKALNSIDVNVCVSKNIIDNWIELTEAKSKKWINIHNCVREDEVAEIKTGSPLEYRRRLELPENEFLICCLASVQHRKGQDILLDQMDSILADIPQARVIFIGPVLHNWGGDAILQQAENKKYSDRVHFLGPKTNALEYVYACDMLVLPSREEALPLSIMEAMALGRTCVASDICGIPEMVSHEETGLMFSLDNPEDLTKHIVRLARNSAEREQMAANAEARYWECFSRERHTQRWREVLQEILDDNLDTP